MQATTATTTPQREQTGQARMRALVRFNGLAFHSLAVASLLETAVPAQAARLAQSCAAWPDVGLWLEQAWWPQRAELGRQLREYVEVTWPEFEWNGAWQDFQAGYRPGGGPDGGTAIDVLGVCVTSAQAALFYRALAAGADDPELRALTRLAALDHARHFDYFRALFERSLRDRRVGFFTAWRTLGAVCRRARDHQVAAAFHALERNWKSTPIVPVLGYAEYRQRMAQFIQRHAAPGLVERTLFRPWLTLEQGAPPAPAAGERHWPRAAAQPV